MRLALLVTAFLCALTDPATAQERWGPTSPTFFVPSDGFGDDYRGETDRGDRLAAGARSRARAERPGRDTPTFEVWQERRPVARTAGGDAVIAVPLPGSLLAMLSALGCLAMLGARRWNLSRR